MSETHRITVDPGQCGGMPCLRGLRIRVKDVLDLLAAGADRAEILADHPLLEAGDIVASLQHAARQADQPTPGVAWKRPPTVLALLAPILLAPALTRPGGPAMTSSWKLCNICPA